jgi:hypothetical protein
MSADIPVLQRLSAETGSITQGLMSERIYAPGTVRDRDRYGAVSSASRKPCGRHKGDGPSGVDFWGRSPKAAAELFGAALAASFLRERLGFLRLGLRFQSIDRGL